MTDSLFNSPAKSVGNRSSGEPNYLTDSDYELDFIDLIAEVPGSSDLTVADGWVKFRNNKKWKRRWGVVTKLSPAADCLHLQLYRDSRDRYKQGQTKASLSLQHFLGVETGFTLDKESNTIAIICQDVTVILAFDTRERLIQWQVKIASNLGEDLQFLVLISQAPSRAKIATGPARLHVQEMKFSMTSGVPPRLIGIWEIGHLRRYGVIEGRFCFEGGSRCGKGEGLYVLVTDKGGEITQTLQMAAQGKLATCRRHVVRKPSAPVPDSPRKLKSKHEDMSSETLQHYYTDADIQGRAERASLPYWSVESRHTDLDSYYGCGDTASVHTHAEASWPNPDGRSASGAMERCVSCISKLGAPSMSRSSTGNTSIPFSTTWTMEPVPQCIHQNIWSSGSDRLSVSSRGTGSSSNSEYSVSTYITSQHDVSYSDSTIIPKGPSLPPKNTSASGCHCCPPNRPPKPMKELPNSASPKKEKINKPPMPLPAEIVRQLPEICARGPYDNYDVPKNICKDVCIKQPLRDPNNRSSMSPTIPVDYYDTPKNLKDAFCTGDVDSYGNYDTPPPAKTIQKPCGCVWSFARQAITTEPKGNRPCQQAFCSVENRTMFSAHRDENATDNRSVPIQKVKLSGQGKMPIVNACGEVAIYATVDRSKKLMKVEDHENWPHGTNYENVEPESVAKSGRGRQEASNYENIEFAQSLEYYENSKDVLQKAGIKVGENMEKVAGKINNGSETAYSGVELKVCKKCGHTCQPVEENEDQEDEKAKNLVQDYLVMEPSHATKETINKTKESTSPGYLPMFPCNKTEYLKHVAERGHFVEKFASASSLPSCVQPGWNGFDFEGKIAGSSALVRPPSANLVRRLFDAEADVKALSRKRSSSADSSRYLREYEEAESTDSCQPSPRKTVLINRITSNSLTSLPYQSPKKGRDEQGLMDIGNAIEEEMCERTIIEDAADNDDLSSSGSLQTLVHEFAPECAESAAASAGASVNIRRSSSVPCKSANNRDSSSSNDSGVSTTSLKQRGAEFGEVESPRRTASSVERQHARSLTKGISLHSSLPRRSKSSDPLQELSFNFQLTEVPGKSSSAEAEVPVCSGKKGYFGTGDGTVPYMDSRSTSSGTSDMSDYIETLSLSSHSSSDAPDSFPRVLKEAATTLRPRSGNEYHKIDRSILDGNVKNQRAHYANISPLAEKSESPSPGYVSSSPAHEVQCADFG